MRRYAIIPRVGFTTIFQDNNAESGPEESVACLSYRKGPPADQIDRSFPCRAPSVR